MPGGARGRGKVVPRQPPPTVTADAQRLVQACAAGAVTSSSRTATANSAEVSPPMAAPPVTCTNSSRELTKSCHAASTPIAADTIVSVPGPACQQQWRCAAYLEGGHPVELPAHQLGSFNSRQLLRQHQPVLIRGNQLASCRVKEATLNTQRSIETIVPSQSADQIATPMDTAEQAERSKQQHVVRKQQLLVLCSPADTNRFIAADVSKNLPGSYYHVRKPETGQLQMTFMEWFDSYRSWNHSRLLLQALVCTWELKAVSAGARIWPNTAVWPHLSRLLQMAPTLPPKQTSKPTTAAAAAPRGSSPIDWAQLQQLLSDGQYSSTGQLHLLAGGRDALLPARYETSDRLICQVAGRQKLLLLAPGLAFKGLYPYPVAHPYDGYSCVDWEEPELGHWPAAAQVQGLVCELSPGDTLLVPAYWFVHSQLQQPACVALVLHLQPLPSKLLSREALLLQLSRMIECWVGAEVGTANVRQWILILAEGREWQQLAKQLATVKGYKQIKVCHMVLKHLQQVLALTPVTAPTCGRSQWTAPVTADDVEDGVEGAGGAPEAAKQRHHISVLEAEARTFLSVMCEERLMPTYWLNEGISDPLYLKYQPQHYLIREDAQAAKYPMLFRHKLIEHRPDWMQHAERLQLGSRQHTKRLTS